MLGDISFDGIANEFESYISGSTKAPADSPSPGAC